jgi:UDP-N-acetyl-2-amino-2-deoxyglucuronate dehydrogenase
MYGHGEGCSNLSGIEKFYFMKNFALTGVAGYIAPRHLQAIKNTGNQLLAAVDPHDSVGLLDNFFSNASFFTEFERFDRHLEKLRRCTEHERVHFISICSPNHLHDAHIRHALRIGADAICEKPLVLKPWNLDALEELETETGRKVNTVLQLRLHPTLIQLKKQLLNSPSGSKKHEICLTYITGRGLWYQYSWKGSPEHSGGLATNIGIHFFDALLWLFGKPQYSIVHCATPQKMAGFLELQQANVRWFLSIDRNDLPEDILAKEKTTFRSITIDGHEIEFTDGFADLHTRTYEEVLKGNGFGIDTVRPSLRLVYEIRNAMPRDERGHQHPFIQHSGRKVTYELLCS